MAVVVSARGLEPEGRVFPAFEALAAGELAGAGLAVDFPNDRDPADLVPWLDRLALVRVRFPGMGDGRGFSTARVLREVPGAALAQDSAGRETDIAIDHSEFHHLDTAQINQVVAIMRAEGLNATVSSIHINGWIGDHDKWQGACWIARELLGRDLPSQVGRWIYIGDSTNDQVMFQHFPHSVGVANIRRFVDQLQYPPRWITLRIARRLERRRGF